jgi:hypothetical protein
VSGGTAQASAALRAYLIDTVRGGRAIAPLVTYNTWFAYATGVDEASRRLSPRPNAEPPEPKTMRKSLIE